ncbi:MAG TPA: DUF6438 domain-containing protein [Gemmatimonadales bacterium]|nr:DUF6438 domain-containing protein [Gemmatimonadales bacterium]
MTRAAALVLLMHAAACAPRQTAATSQETSPAQDPTSAPAITLERTACFGRCPVYRIAVSPTGSVSYEGTANVRRIGAATSQIPADQVTALTRELEQAGYFSFADLYTSTELSCGRYATDLPTVITSVTLRGRTKRIEHDYGCGGVPGALAVLERRIDEVLRSSQFTGR